MASVKLTPGHLGIKDSPAPVFDSLEKICQGGGPGIDDIFAWNVNRGPDRVVEIWFQFEDLLARQQAKIRDLVQQAFFQHSGKPLFFLPGPCNDHGAGFQQRQSQAFMNFQILPVPCLHAFPFKGTGRCIKTGVENGAVALACTIENVRRFFKENDGGAFKGKAAGHGTADNAATDYCHVTGGDNRSLLGRWGRIVYIGFHAQSLI